jgi:hypothetical protein
MEIAEAIRGNLLRQGSVPSRHPLSTIPQTKTIEPPRHHTSDADESQLSYTGDKSTRSLTDAVDTSIQLPVEFKPPTPRESAPLLRPLFHRPRRRMTQ